MHGREDYYKTWSELDRKCLTFACKDLKRLYRNHVIDQYLTYKPFFLEEGKKVMHHLPVHITFTLHDRRTSGETAEGAEVSSVGLRIRLRWVKDSTVSGYADGCIGLRIRLYRFSMKEDLLAFYSFAFLLFI